MYINLNLFKFHSFKYKKNITNEWRKTKNNSLKCEDDVLNKIILNDVKNKIKHCIDYKNISQLFTNLKSSKNGNSNHSIRGCHKEILINVIKNCHPNLYSDLQQLFFEKNPTEDIIFYQLSINPRSRIIIVNKDETIYPLLIDLNHCFYETKKSYDNNVSKKTFPWDFREKQKNLKEQLKNELNFK